MESYVDIPRMTPTEHQRLLVGVLEILDDFQFNGYGTTVLDSLRGGLMELFKAPAGTTRARMVKMRIELPDYPLESK